MNYLDNFILKTDSYKLSHYRQYPPKSEYVYSYLESRYDYHIHHQYSDGIPYSETVFFGLQYLLKKYFVGQVIYSETIDQAEAVVEKHMGPGNFNRAGWERILIEHGGRLPLEIKAVPEGKVVGTRNVLLTVENTDPELYWLTNYVETMLTHIWSPITVATQSYLFRKLIQKYLRESGAGADGLDYKLHDFGFRGVSSFETAALAGAAHLLSFKGSDTMAANALLMDYYGETIPPSVSIPASEHSTITSWGRDHELEAMANMLEQYPTGLVACVSDSFDIYKACSEYWGEALRDKILNRDGCLVIRPDSGDPIDVVLECLEILTSKFGYTTTPKGFKLLPPQVRLIQGDGVDYDCCEAILKAMQQKRFAADNIAFGSGGALLQKLNRDTLAFAFKCSEITVAGESREVYKEPVGAASKNSKRGRLKLVDGPTGLMTERLTDSDKPDKLRTVFRDGELLVDETFSEIRGRLAVLYTGSLDEAVDKATGFLPVEKQKYPEDFGSP